MNFEYYKFWDYVRLIITILSIGYQILIPILKYTEVINISWWWCFIPLYVVGLFFMWLGTQFLNIGRIWNA